MEQSDSSCPFHAPTTVEERTRQWSVFQPWLQQDPITYWNEMREHTPIARSEEHGGYWILTRYEDIEWAARNPEIFSSAELIVPYFPMFETKQIPIERDGEDHRLWRVALRDLFSPAVVNAHTPQIREAAAEAIDAIAKRGTCEFVADFAQALPVETFLIVFGIGREHLSRVIDHKDWLHENWAAAESAEQIQAANQPLRDFFSEQIERCRREGPENRLDVIGKLLTTSYDGRPLTDDEMINIIFMTMMASLDSTTSALSLIFLHLAQNPGVQERVTESPDIIPMIIEELLRREPVTTTARLVTRDVERHGVKFLAGDKVLMSWGFAGLDPAVFDHPLETDFERASTRHLAFGVGPHRCLGMGVARRLLAVAVEEWHRRIPRYRPAPGPPPELRYSVARGAVRFELDLL